MGIRVYIRTDKRNTWRKCGCGGKFCSLTEQPGTWGFPDALCIYAVFLTYYRWNRLWPSSGLGYARQDSILISFLSEAAGRETKLYWKSLLGSREASLTRTSLLQVVARPWVLAASSGSWTAEICSSGHLLSSIASHTLLDSCNLTRRAMAPCVIRLMCSERCRSYGGSSQKQNSDMSHEGNLSFCWMC